MKKNILTIIYLVGFLTIISSCAKKESHEISSPMVQTSGDVVELTDEQYKSVGVEIGHIEDRSLSGGVSVTGMLDVPPQNLVNITAPFGGFLRSTTLLQGMHVVRGQVIAVVENPEYIQLQQDFLDTRSQVKYLEMENQRQEELAKENVNSRKALQKSQADLESMQAKNNGLRAKLKMIRIDAEKLSPTSIRSTIELQSPINGYVTQVNTPVGAFVNPTESMFQIVDTEHLHAELTAFERDIPKIKIGQNIRFTLANESKQRTAKVYLIGREISQERTVRIHGHLDQEDSDLIPGMYLKAYIETGDHSVPSLPEGSVVIFEDKSYVFIPDGKSNKFKMINVTTGLRENGFIEVHLPKEVDGKAPVVVKGAYNLLSKLKIGDNE